MSAQRSPGQDENGPTTNQMQSGDTAATEAESGESHCQSLDRLNTSTSLPRITPVQRSATPVFTVPEILANILSHLSVVDFALAQQAHPHCMAVAKQFRSLRRRFFLGAVPSGLEGEIPEINPLFSWIAATMNWDCQVGPPGKYEGLPYADIHKQNYNHPDPPEQWQLELADQMLLTQPPAPVHLMANAFSRKEIDIRLEAHECNLGKTIQILERVDRKHEALLAKLNDYYSKPVEVRRARRSTGKGSSGNDMIPLWEYLKYRPGTTCTSNEASS
ncbi:hypothetical protein Slin14017_G091160 [Septoria linicola]|nr:hypothetical protein Slin14017_G091160 [Septoria linicola]